jgi:hypothetical protein
MIQVAHIAMIVAALFCFYMAMTNAGSADWIGTMLWTALMLLTLAGLYARAEES